MRRITTFLLAAGFTGILATGCNSDEKTYSDAEYILFADTMSTNMVFQDEAYFNIPIASTVACDYDRTIGVEVIDKGSTAIEGYHYRLRSNTITIKAGERTANVEVAGSYDHIQDTDSLGFILKLEMPEQLNWSDLYTDYDKTKVVLYKGCPYDPETFTGWCVVTSLLLYDYPSALDTSYQRLILTEKHPTEPNTIILRDFLYDGYDVTMRLNTDDPAEPLVEMDEDQVLSDEQTVFGQINADIVLNEPGGCRFELSGSPADTLKQDLSLAIERLDIAQLLTVLPFMPQMQGKLNLKANYIEDSDNYMVKGNAGIDSFAYEHVPVGNIGGDFAYEPLEGGAHSLMAALSHNSRRIAYLGGRYTDADGGVLNAGMSLERFPLSIASAFVLPFDRLPG